MKKLFYFSTLFIILCSVALAQEEAKLDTVLQNQDKMLQNQAKILHQVTYVDPLEGKHFGIEFSPALLLVSLGNNDLTLSGGFSLFNMAPQAEIAFPFYYRSYDPDQSLLTADAQYRLFFSKRRGFYASAGLRYARITDEERYDWDNDERGDLVTVDKFGAHFGIGYRYFSKIGLYWGTSIILGTYFSDDTDKIDDIYMDAGKFLIDIELLKIGYAF